MLCDYGCGQEAKFQFKNGKWCCSNHFRQCPNQSKKYKNKNNPMYGRHHKKSSIKKMMSTLKKIDRSKITKLSYNDKLIKVRKNKAIELWSSDKFREKNTQAIKNSWKQQNIINKHKRTITKLKKYSFFSKVEEMRYNPDKPGEKEIQVHCKNHNCPNSKEQGGWFTPLGRQLEGRLNALENNGNDLNYFYCSNKCKQECPLYNLKSDPFKNITHSYTSSEYQQFRTNVLERDDYKCQYCGKKAEHVHHERPQKLEPFFALDPDLAWSVCKKCHYKYGHSDKDCNTGNLANKICQNTAEGR